MKLYNLKSTRLKRKLLRQNSTEAENLLWEKLRNKQFHKLKFFRQYGIGHYIADFYCPKTKPVIEVDGPQHYSNDGEGYDKERQRFFEALDITTLRFSNNEVVSNIDLVLSRIQHFMFSGAPSSFEEGERGSWK